MRKRSNEDSSARRAFALPWPVELVVQCNLELADLYALDGHRETLERQAAVLTKLAAAAAG